jgi:CDP-diacylglycerol--glycerol-3-phosphate 3-phosphatidyltransferase
MTVPNVLSILRIILSPLFLILFLEGEKSGNCTYLNTSLVIFFVAVLTDWYDGWYARKYKTISRVGIFIDPLADKILTTFAFILFYIKNIMPLWMVVLIGFRDIVVTALRSYDELRGITIKTSFIAKAKTFFQMTYIFAILFLIILPKFQNNPDLEIKVNVFFNSIPNYLLMLFITIITIYTGIDYFVQKRVYLKNEIDKA